MLTSNWFVLTGATAPTLRFICFPHAGGHGGLFRGWVAHLPAHVQVCGVQLPGRQKRMREPPATRVTPVAEEIARELDRAADVPCVLFGQCTGALLAFEVARRLESTRPRHLFVSCCRAPHLPDNDAPIHASSDEHLLSELERLGGTPAEVARHPALLRLLLPVLRADFEMAATYAYVPGRELDCPITAFGGTEDSVVAPRELDGWSEHTARRFERHLFCGGHYLLATAEAELLAHMAQAVETRAPRWAARRTARPQAGRVRG